ncbi:TPA: gfo/Idh/MocA family oxidoreductase [Candidatus Poribacteria bacterium]|nr:gfo/Idh/MocA family oxidoreductase [Candidatus Poribacteria bacterium]
MLKIGIIGAGTMGGMHADCYSEIPDAKVVAVADARIDAAKRVAEKHSAQAFDKIDDVLSIKDIDIIDICLPTSMHKENVLKAASAKKHIFCEKPIARELEDGKEMISAVKKAGVKFMVGHVLRFFHEYVTAKRIIESGKIGNPVMIRTTRAAGHPQGWSNWYSNVQMAGGVPLDLIIHDFDFLRWCFGEVDHVYAKGLTYANVPDIDYSLVTIRFKNGVIAHVEGSWAHISGFFVKLEVAGDGGVFEFDSRTSSPLRIVTKSAKAGGGGVEVPQNPVIESPYTTELKYFIDAVKNDKEPPVTGEDALRAIEIAIASLKSMETGKPIIFPLI